MAAGKAGNALLLPKSDGSAWKAAHQHRPTADACEQAKIEPPISFHILRHWAKGTA
jgi:hypothetical protein